MSINTAKPLLAASFLLAVERTVKMAKQLFIFPVQSVFFQSKHACVPDYTCSKFYDEITSSNRKKKKIEEGRINKQGRGRGRAEKKKERRTMRRETIRRIVVNSRPVPRCFKVALDCTFRNDCYRSTVIIGQFT